MVERVRDRPPPRDAGGVALGVNVAVVARAGGGDVARADPRVAAHDGALVASHPPLLE